MSSDLQRLRAVQEHDTTVDRLRHRRRTLPELGRLAAVEESIVRVESSLAEEVVRRDEVARRQRRFEDDLASTEARIADLQRRLYSGVVSAPRELQAMQADLESLRRRRSALEDQVLETMDEGEPIEAGIGALEEERAELDREGSRLRAAVAEAQTTIDAELEAEAGRRSHAATGLPPELTTLYDGLRAKLGGIGAAVLAGGRCGGCNLSLPATELDRIRREPPDAVVRCEHCGRILIRPE